MHKGQNLALINEKAKHLYDNQIKTGVETKICVFISHRGCDVNIAKEVAEDIMNIGLNVYLDTNDDALRIASLEHDASSIVKYIETGLKYSSHLLVIVTDKTQESWWVPYEIGYAKKSGKNIASFLVEEQEISDFPDYLKIEETIKSPEQYILYINKLHSKLIEQFRYGGLFENSNADKRLNGTSYVKTII